MRQRMPEEDLPLLTNILRMERRKENAKNRAVGIGSLIIIFSFLFLHIGMLNTF